ncbi:MAG TPA: HEAT repeat domain-containing protein [bacterium]|nr:HEAT repeat domain-containing protein [bacterium]
MKCSALHMILCFLVWFSITFVSASADDFTGLKACPDEEIKMGEKVLEMYLDNPSDTFRSDKWCPVWSSREPSIIDPKKDFDDMDEEEQKKYQWLIYEYDRRTFCCELPLKTYQFKNHLTSEFTKELVLIDIANSRDPRIVPLLEDIIKSDISPELRMNATNQLCRLNVKSQAVISNAINDNEIRVKGVAAECLLRWGYEDKALFVLERIASGEEKQSYLDDISRDRERVDSYESRTPKMTNKEPFHRAYNEFQNHYIRVLGMSGKDDAVMFLYKLLCETDSQQMEDNIIRALHKSNNPKVVDFLIEHLQRKPDAGTSTKDWPLVGILSNDKYPLQSRFDAAVYLLRSENSYTQSSIEHFIVSLASSDDKEALPHLIRMINDANISASLREKVENAIRILDRQTP